MIWSIIGVLWGFLIIPLIYALETPFLKNILNFEPFLRLVIFAPIIEETFKYVPIFKNKINLLFFSLGVAISFSYIEFFGAYQFIQSTNILILRIVPHFIFTFLFILGSKFNKLIGISSALVGHIIWNYAIWQIN